MRNGKPKPEPDGEIFVDKLPPIQEAWYRDHRFARYGLEDGAFAKYSPDVIAIIEEKVVGRGKNPLHLVRRVAKKLKVDMSQIILVDPNIGVL